jgi:hypothetical protein
MNRRNELLEEIWEARRKIEQESNNDLGEIYKKYSRKQTEHPAEYYSGEPVVLKKSKAA